MRKGLEMSFKHLQIKLREKMVKINCTAGEDFPSVVMPQTARLEKRARQKQYSLDLKTQALLQLQKKTLFNWQQNKAQDTALTHAHTCTLTKAAFDIAVNKRGTFCSFRKTTEIFAQKKTRPRSGWQRHLSASPFTLQHYVQVTSLILPTVSKKTVSSSKTNKQTFLLVLQKSFQRKLLLRR